MSKDNLDNKTGKLEQEFIRNFNIHKYAIIASGLLSLNGIYNEPLMYHYRDKFLELDEDSRARAITKDMLNEHADLYDAMYEYCWQYIDEILPEDTCYR